MTELIGYQERITWMGAEIVTLADIYPGHPRTMIVGLNPAPPSVDAGHYYQGSVGQRQLRRLADAGLFAPPDGQQFEEAAIAAGVGFTDIVKRPTAREGGVTADELRFGSETLTNKLSALNVGLIVCVFRHPVKVLLGSAGTPGMQAKRTEWGAQVFRMPGPFDGAERVKEVMSELSGVLSPRGST